MQPPAAITHRSLALAAYQVPAPFRAFAVRSEEPQHAGLARSPYGRVHGLAGVLADGPTRAALAAEGLSRVKLEGFSDVTYARTSLAELAQTAPGAAQLGEGLALALQATGVLGGERAAYQRCVTGRIDYLASRGAGFHNDVGQHWSRCLFWVLALQLAEVEFVMPHAGLRLGLAPGELLVFDPSLAHGLCRPGDQGRAMADSFENGEPRDDQVFLTGEISLSDDQWAALGSPWLPLEQHAESLDLTVAEFDDRSGTFQRLHALRNRMQRSECAEL